MPIRENLSDFTVLGPGGVGGLVAALLDRAGHDVTVVAAERTAAHISERGLEVASPLHGGFTARPRAVPLLDRPAGVLLVTTKGTDLAAALDRVPAETVDGALVVPLLNGFEHIEVLRARYPRAAVLSAAVHVGAARTAPGRIEHTSPYNRVEVSGHRAGDVAAALRWAGIDTGVRHDGAALLWDKYAFLLPTAMVCAHERAPIGPARERRMHDMEAVLDEVARVAAARGITVDTAAVLRTIAERPAHTRPSLLFDRESGRPMEIDALGGALLRAAESAEGGPVPVPVSARLTADLERVDADRSV